MDCVGVMDSGNYALKLCRILEKKGYVFEVVSTPCQIARNGCGYSLRFPEQYIDIVIAEGKESKAQVREVYKVTPMFTKNRYDRIL